MAFLGILGLVGTISFFVMSVVSVFKKGKHLKRNSLIAVGFFVLFIVGAVNSSDETDGEQASAEPQVEEKGDQEEGKEDESEETEDDRSIVEKLKDNDDVDKASLEDGFLLLEADGKTTFSENTLFLSVYELFEAMHDGFQDDDVKEVEVILRTTMVDQKGNESEEPVIKYTYTRDSFEELNYDKFSNMAFGEQWRILNESDAYFVHPGIYNNLKEKYTDNLSHGKSKVRKYE